MRALTTGFHTILLGAQAMKKMIRMAVMTAAMFVAVTTVAKAQDSQQQGRRGGRGPNITVILKDSLHVSDAVAAKADSIVKDYAAKSQEARQSAGDDRQAMMAKMQEINKARNDAIKALLTDEQKAAFDKLVPQGGRRGGGGR